MTMKDMARSGWRHAAIAVFLVTALVSTAPADMSYSGSLSTDDGGLTGFGGWASGARLSWSVDDTTTQGYWHYSYTLSVTSKAISHMIIEVSETFTAASLFNLSWSDYEIGTFVENNGNPGMGSSSMFGLKIDKTSGTSVTISFDSNRVPVWGDFYAKDGQDSGDWTYLYNSGLGYVDPLADPHNGPHWSTVQLPTGASTNIAHLLVPDSKVVPAPGAVVLGSLGLAFAGWLRRRKMMS